MKHKRNVYLNMKSIKEARTTLFDAFESNAAPAETVDVVNAKGRVLAKPAIAAISSPNFHAAAMDGVAVNAKDTFGAGEDHPKELKINDTAFWVNTGHALPDNTNAVIMIEHLNVLDDTAIEIEAPVFPWQHVRKMGEDIVATQLLFPRKHRVTAYSMGALLTGGVFQVEVYQKPRVLIIPTGSELRQWQDVTPEKLSPGEVIESNSTVLGGLCEDYGAGVDVHPMLKDNLDNIQENVRSAAQKGYDMICIIGGSSAGSEDFAKPVISSLGKVLVHGVTMMPGKPVIFGKISDIPVFGIPGYPVSAIAAFELFAGPLLLKIQQLPRKEEETSQVFPARKMASKLGHDEFIRVKIGSVDGKLMASQLPRGSGNITTLTEADGIIKVPRHAEGVSENEAITARLLRPLSSIENTVVITGSHDNTLDVMADQIKRLNGDISVSSSHVGSMGGLMAVKKGACHAAGIHLLDPETGDYNISYIEKYLKAEKIKLVHLVMREQGLIVLKGNPDKIESIEDLKNKGLPFINRQSGSGTRILFDYKLNTLGIASSEIKGYENDEYTHMSVAAAVISGRASAGLGIKAAANALDLDFIPVVTERYELVIPDRFYRNRNIRVLLETIRSDGFKNRVTALGGYHTEDTGKVVLET